MLKIGSKFSASNFDNWPTAQKNNLIFYRKIPYLLV